MPHSASAQRRWAVNLAGWEPEPEEWAFVLRLLPDAEADSVQRYKLAEDRRRALISRMLQRKCASEVLGIAFSSVVIQRTKGGKPFAVAAVDRPHVPNFNFNISHEGHYVVLASEGHCLCGIDVAAPQKLRRGPQHPVATYLQSFRKQFTEREWAAIHAAGSSETAVADAFQRNWSLKEAFVKLRGDGLAFDMSRVEFRLADGSAASNPAAYMDGKRLTRWTCTVQPLGDSHWVSVVRGPPDAVIDAWGVFTATLQQPDMTDAELQEHFRAPEPAFQILSVSDLVPASAVAGYCAAGGDVL